MVACEAQSSRITEEQVVAAAAQIGLEVPKGKVRGERAAAAPRSSKRGVLLAALLVLVAGGGAFFYVLGNPVEFFEAAELPASRRAPARHLPAPIAALSVPAGPTEMGPPPAIAGSFSVLVGTFDTARQVAQLETALREQRLPIYFLDVLVGPGDLRRRVLIGRFPTREEADAVRQALGTTMTEARVVPGALERMLVVP